jgi:hypothetical protein
MFCADPLHQIKQGVWGKHFWLWFKTNYLSKGGLVELDARSALFLLGGQMATVGFYPVS